MHSDSEITLTIHGLDQFNKDVDGEVFAEKLNAFLKGLAAADIATNGKRRHKFLISGLEKNTATAKLREQVVSKGHAPASSVKYYYDGITAISDGTPAARDLPEDFVKQVARLNKGVGETFPFGEVKLSEGRVIRIDEYLRNRAERLLSDIEAKGQEPEVLFSGSAFGTFDGVLKEVDLRGETKRAALILTAGGLEIPCVVDQIDIDVLRAALDRRTVVSGLARYSGEQGLPDLIEVTDIRSVASSSDLQRWRGAFDVPHPSEEDWENL